MANRRLTVMELYTAEPWRLAQSVHEARAAQRRRSWHWAATQWHGVVWVADRFPRPRLAQLARERRRHCRRMCRLHGERE